MTGHVPPLLSSIVQDVQEEPLQPAPPHFQIEPPELKRYKLLAAATIRKVAGLLPSSCQPKPNKVSSSLHSFRR